MIHTLEDVSRYLLANDETCRSWPKEKFDRWLEFYWSEGFVCTVLDYDDGIAGLAMIRPVMVDDAHDPMAWDQEGNCLHVTQIICTAKGAMAVLGFAVLHRFGMRDYVSWHKQPSNKLSIHKASTLRRNLFRNMEVTHYGPK